MKIALISGSSSIHTIRWANSLSDAGHEVHVISQHPPCDPFSPSVKVHQFPFRGILGYFLMAPAVKKLLKQLKPDIVNAHYASGYGTTARLVNAHPFVLSVWGSDVYDFPYKSSLHKWLVCKNILAADTVASTSYCMAEQTRSLVPELGDIPITPFGVDMSSYANIQSVVPNNEHLTIGTVKTMAETYGIDTLIHAFAILKEKLNNTDQQLAKKIRLRLVGSGPQTEELKQLTINLGLKSKVDFVGRVPHQEVPKELAKLDIYIALSRRESFGVAIIEAGAAGRPVVVSNTGGLPEVTLDGITGLVVPKENPQAAADAIEKLVLNPQLRLQMGLAGKEHVSTTYSWDTCIENMIQVFENTIQKYHNH